MKDPNDFMLKPAHTEAEYEALEAELADMTADYHRWHDAYMELKYPGGGQRVAVTPDQARIAHLEADLVGEKESAKFYNRRLYQTGEDLHDALTRIATLEAALREAHGELTNAGHQELGECECKIAAALSGARTADDTEGKQP